LAKQSSQAAMARLEKQVGQLRVLEGLRSPLEQGPS